MATLFPGRLRRVWINVFRNSNESAASHARRYRRSRRISLTHDLSPCLRKNLECRLNVFLRSRRFAAILVQLHAQPRFTVRLRHFVTVQRHHEPRFFWLRLARAFFTEVDGLRLNDSSKCGAPVKN